MASIDVAADIVADSDASTGTDLTAFYAAGTSMLADSSSSENGTANFAGSSSMSSDSSMGSTLKDAETLVLAAVSNSLFGATLSSGEHPAATMLGDSIFFIDPAKVTVVHFVKQTSVPKAAQASKIPKLRITPPAPPAASLSISTAAKRPQRRE
jgi:hypothetical protein